jgi:hypothetical protein
VGLAAGHADSNRSRQHCAPVEVARARGELVPSAHILQYLFLPLFVPNSRVTSNRDRSGRAAAPLMLLGNPHSRPAVRCQGTPAQHCQQTQQTLLTREVEPCGCQPTKCCMGDAALVAAMCSACAEVPTRPKPAACLTCCLVALNHFVPETISLPQKTQCQCA